MRVTRKDVALLAGVSEASVSYVMNKSRSVSPETSKKVWDAVKELNYTADMVARSMVKNETRQLAVLANDLSNPYFAEIIPVLKTQLLIIIIWSVFALPSVKRKSIFNV